MGAWGTGPFDNDAAGDATDGVLSAEQLDLFKFTKDLLDDSDPLVFRAGVEVLIAALDKRFPTLIQKALTRIQELGTDQTFLEDWDEPKKVQKAIKSQFKRLKRRVGNE